MMNNSTEEEIKQAFKDRANVFSKDKTEITRDYDRADDVTRIEKLVKEIIRSEEGLFFIGERAFGVKVIDCRKPSVFADLKYFIKSGAMMLIDKTFPIHSINPYVALFKNRVNSLVEKIDPDVLHNYPTHDLAKRTDDVTKMVDMLNEFINDIRQEAKSQQFKKIINNHERLVRKNTKSLMDYIDYLFSKHSKLLVLRVDFRYEKNNKGGAFLTEDEIYGKYLEVKKDREHFFNNKRANGLFDDMVGYVWKLEYTLLTGFHYHMLFFYDGANVREDITWAKKLGEYWADTITVGKGLYYNCNAGKDKYKVRGIGMVNYYDHELREGLKIAAGYLTKPDYYARMIVPKNGRTFGKGEILPKPKASNRGRPRKYQYSVPASTRLAFKLSNVHYGPAAP